MTDKNKKDEIEKYLQKEIQDYWLPLLKTNGEFDEQKIKNELRDLLFIYEQVGEVYCTITGNILSKPMYYADTIIEVYEEQLQGAYQEGVNDTLANNQS